MTVAVLSAPASMTAGQYHRISKHVAASRTGPPPGRRFHACFGHGDHLMVFDVWDSVEHLDAFTATLLPILAIEHIDMAPPEPLEIHDLIDSGDSRALRKTIAELRDKAFFIRPIEKVMDKLHSVKGKPSDTAAPDETPRARDDSPPEHPSAGHLAAARRTSSACSTCTVLSPSARAEPRRPAATGVGGPRGADIAAAGEVTSQRATIITIERGASSWSRLETGSHCHRRRGPTATALSQR
jgi:hypothetical protein